MKTMIVVMMMIVTMVAVGSSQNSMVSLINKNSGSSLETNEIISEGSVPSENEVASDITEEEEIDLHLESDKHYGFEYFPLNTEISYVYDSNAGETESGVVPSGEELVLTFDAGKISYEQQFFKGEDGIYLTRTESSALLFFGTTVTYPEPVLRLPLPLKVGKKWTWEGFEIADGDTGSLTIRGEALAEEKVKTPLGEFDCLKIQLKVESEHGSKNTVTEWLAPGIGVVKFHAALEGTGLTAFLQDIFGLDELTFDLTGFDVNRN